MMLRWRSLRSWNSRHLMWSDDTMVGSWTQDGTVSCDDYERTSGVRVLNWYELYFCMLHGIELRQISGFY